MGMSRDEALKVWLPVIQMGVETMPECKEALDMAIDTMRKCQKIEQIIQEWRDSGFGRGQLYEVINGVLQDENVD